MIPAHLFIFRGMTEAIVRRAELIERHETHRVREARPVATDAPG
jgi:hypothetical protein